MSNSAKTVCRICFIVLVAFTFVIWCVLLGGALQHDRSDDVLGSFLTVELSCIILSIVLLQEYIFYKSIKYIFSEKTAIKTIFYAILFLLDLLFLIFEVTYILSYIL